MDNQLKTQFDRISKVIELMDQNYVKPEELSAIFDAFASIVKELRDNLASDLQKGDEASDAKIVESIKSISQLIKSLDQKMSEKITTVDIKYKNEIKNIFDRIKSVGDQVSSVSSKIDQKIAKAISVVEKSMNDKSESDFVEMKLLVDSVRKEFNQALEDIKKYLEDEIEHLRILVGKGNGGTHYISTPGTGGKVVRVYDLTPLLNGVTKTFALPANWRVISVSSTSFPITFEPIVDYTSTDSSITFTDTINATTTLASGQTVIVVYSEP